MLTLSRKKSELKMSRPLPPPTAEAENLWNQPLTPLPHTHTTCGGIKLAENCACPPPAGRAAHYI